MPNPTPCTACNAPGDGLYCQNCGAKQPQRYPERDLADYLIARYDSAREKFKALPDGEDTATSRRIVARYFAARGRLWTLYGLCKEVDRAFTLPVDDAPPSKEA